VPAARPRVVGGHAYTPARYESWKQEASWRLHTQTSARYDGPVSVTVVVRRDRVEIELDETADTRPKGLRGDLDNYVKGVLDALQDAGIIRDDRQVHELHATFEEESHDI